MEGTKVNGEDFEPKTQKIILVDQRPSSQLSPLENIERVSKITSALAIPLLIAVFGWMIQERLAENATKQEYAKLAISILRTAESRNDTSLREWAVKFLNENSMLELDSAALQELKSGKQDLPAAITFSPDGKLLVTADPAEIKMWEAAKSKADPVAVCSPDGMKILMKGRDNGVEVRDAKTGEITMKLEPR